MPSIPFIEVRDRHKEFMSKYSLVSAHSRQIFHKGSRELDVPNSAQDFSDATLKGYYYCVPELILMDAES